MHDGIRLSEILIWKNFKPEEKLIFEEIFTKIEHFFLKSEREKLVDRFAEADRLYEEKIRIKDSVQQVLNDFCRDAVDLPALRSSLRGFLRDVDELTIERVNFPMEIQRLVPLSLQLAPFCKSKIWLKFFENFQRDAGRKKTVRGHFCEN